MNYFAKPIPGSLYTRYYLLAGSSVVAVQISRPDGTEVPEPLHWTDRRPRAREVDKGGPRRGIYEARPLINEKRCSRCREIKSVYSFARHATAGNGLQSYCRTCSTAYTDMRRRKTIKKGAAHSTSGGRHERH